MDFFQAIILAIVEGLTEFLPVSSTGHMVIAQALMGIESTDFVKAFTVMIQLGAILSVVVLYFREFLRFDVPADLSGASSTRRLLGRFRFYWLLLVGILPAVILGLLFDDWVDSVLGEVWIIAVNLVIGGVIMLFIDSWVRRGEKKVVRYKDSFIIGLFQCIAMFLPGMSRSMSTIVGGMAVGLKRETAAEFSFFLAVPTMAGATVYEILKFLKAGDLHILTDNWEMLLVGNAVAFVVALLAIKYFIGYVRKHSFQAFGVYRIIVGGVILLMMASGINLALFQ